MSDTMNVAKCPVADFDSWSEDQMAKPYALYEELRNRCPIGHSPHHGGFVFASNYDNAKEVLINFKTFSSAQGMVLPPRPMRT